MICPFLTDFCLLCNDSQTFLGGLLGELQSHVDMSFLLTVKVTDWKFVTFQLTELCLLRDDLRSLMGIAQQLEPYIKSITSLMEQIQPEVGAVQPEIPTTDPATATAASAPPPANFHRQYNEQLPERIQNAVAVAEYKSR